MIGCWMLVSPFVFRHEQHATGLWLNDLSVGSLLIVLALASYWRPTAWAHWLALPLGAWLVLFGRFSDVPPLAPALQNQIIIGMIVMMFAIVPNEASLPPHAWRRPANTVPD
jgi:hypothetical protein